MEVGMAARFVYVYFMKPLPKRVRDAVPLHVKYWHSPGLPGYQGGPFGDRTGGLITFEATDLAAATALVDCDPFLTHDLIENRWVKEWLPE
jgi:hypothetical protein